MLFHPTYILSKRRNDHHQLIIPLSFRPAREIDRKKPKPFHQNFLVSTDPIYHPTLSSRLDKIEESRKDSRHVARERMGPREEGNLSRIINSGRQKAGRVPSVCSAGGIKRTKGIMPCSSNRGRDPSRGGSVACNGAETARVESTFDGVRLGRDMKNASNAPTQVHGYAPPSQIKSYLGEVARAYLFSFWLTKDLQRGIGENWVEKELFFNARSTIFPDFQRLERY